MAGHSQFKNIMYRKGAQDAKRAKLFAKLIRELTVAARAGQADPQGNPRLRTAITIARAANMPSDNIERAIARGAGGSDGAAYEEVRYEGYGVGGVAVIVEALTDNRNRTAAEVRTAFSKYGGTLADSNSVTFQFARVGSIHFAAGAAGADEMLEAAIEAGAEDCASDATGHDITCEPADFNDVRDALAEHFGAPERAELVWKPNATVPITEDQAPALLKMLEVLDDSNDVQQVAANFDVDEAVIERLGA